MLEKTEGAIKNGQFNETDNIRYTRHKTNKTKTQHTMWWTPLYTNKITQIRHEHSYKQLEVKRRTGHCCYAEIATNTTAQN